VAACAVAHGDMDSGLGRVPSRMLANDVASRHASSR
jgi:hypothetical protein